jgi:hypothetical protein
MDAAAKTVDCSAGGPRQEAYSRAEARRAAVVGAAQPRYSAVRQPTTAARRTGWAAVLRRPRGLSGGPRYSAGTRTRRPQYRSLREERRVAGRQARRGRKALVGLDAGSLTFC